MGERDREGEREQGREIDECKEFGTRILVGNTNPRFADSITDVCPAGNDESSICKKF